MTELLPRKRFQIHLSTAIVMMFVAGGLMWVNFSKRTKVDYAIIDYSYDNLTGKWIEEIDPNSRFTEDNYGWPLSTIAITDMGLNWKYYARVMTGPRRMTTSVYGLFADAAVAIGILLAVWFLGEWLIRRRAARRGA